MNIMPGSAPLEPGARVQNFKIEGLLRHDEFSYTYLARSADQRQVWLRELLPQKFVIREESGVRPREEADRSSVRWWLRRFLDNAATVQRLGGANTVKVIANFEANGTAYCVSEPLSGEPLSEILIREGVLSQARLGKLLQSLLYALAPLHQADLLHLDIHPGNLVVLPDGSGALFNFSALSAPIRLKSGLLQKAGTPPYAAPDELGVAGKVGPWTDLYALAAVAYRALSGQTPPSAAERANGEVLVPTAQATRVQCSAEVSNAIDQALQLAPEQRPRSIAAWCTMLGFDVPVVAVAPPPKVIPLETARAQAPVAEAAPVAAGGSKMWMAAIPVVLLAAGGGYFLSRSKPAPAPAPAPVQTQAAPAAAAAPAAPAATASSSSDDVFTQRLLQAKPDPEILAAQARAKAAADAAAVATGKDAQIARERMQQLEAEVQRLKAVQAANAAAAAQSSAPAPQTAQQAAPVAAPPPPQSTASSGSAGHEPVRVDPIIDKKLSRPPDYPARAREVREEGTVIIEAFVDTDGRITETRLLQSSGFKDLDNTALTDIKSKFRFTPGTLDGKPAAMWKSIKYTWKLDQ